MHSSTVHWPRSMVFKGNTHEVDVSTAVSPCPAVAFVERGFGRLGIAGESRLRCPGYCSVWVSKEVDGGVGVSWWRWAAVGRKGIVSGVSGWRDEWVGMRASKNGHSHGFYATRGRLVWGANVAGRGCFLAVEVGGIRWSCCEQRSYSIVGVEYSRTRSNTDAGGFGVMQIRVRQVDNVRGPQEWAPINNSVMREAHKSWHPSTVTEDWDNVRTTVECEGPTRSSARDPQEWAPIDKASGTTWFKLNVVITHNCYSKTYEL
ncbi:hypothetical protein BU15DRAFT_68877 [Melanogaster broomeanus]|nr:hypothetical protein BU15DRAFT_68877 [Melanogaster broomeanus]